MTKKKESKKENKETVKNPVQLMDITLIDLTGWNPRGEDSFKDEAFRELKQSMKENGFFQHEPLLVRAAGERFQLIAGHRRLQAAKDLSFEVVPVCIRDINDQDAKLLIFIDNFHRKDFSPLEEAQGIRQVLDDGAITQTELARRMGKSQAYVANRLRLLAAPQELKDLIISQEITPAHTQILLPFVGYAVFEDIMKELKGCFESMREVSVGDLERKIIPQVFNREKNVVVLTNFSFDNRKFEEFFDKSQCSSCKDKTKVRAYYTGEKIEYCLNKDCFFVKLVDARNAQDLARQKEVQDLLAKKTVDTTKLDYGTYRTLPPANAPTEMIKWDQAGCSSCDKCKKGKRDENDFVCLDVACFDKKEKAYNKERNRMRKDEAGKAWQICDERLKGISILDNKHLRSLLSKLANEVMVGGVDVALSPWPGIQGEDEIDISKVPDEDLPKAVLRVIIGNGFEYNDPTVESMNRFLEDLGV